jgi:maleylacetate reductase
MSTFRLVTYPREIISGPGSIDQLAAVVDKAGWSRLVLCGSPSMRREGVADALQMTLGDKLVAIYDHVQAHVQDFQLAEVLALAGDCRADALIGFGGGSPIGMAKAVSLALDDERGGKSSAQSSVPVIAIPTTYAGSEMTPVYGVTHNDGPTPRKITVRDPRIAPRVVIYDPDQTAHLPPEVTASSGINALAHCVEALYSKDRNPLASAAAVEGIRMINRALPSCTADGLDRAARADMLTGSHLAAQSLSMTTMGLHHGLCHVLGGSANVPHGIANAIMLPHAMRFNLDSATPELAQVARAMGIVDPDDRSAAQASIDAVFKFIGGLGLPQRLRDVGVSETALPELARLALLSKTVQENVRPLTSQAQAKTVFRAAW